MIGTPPILSFLPGQAGEVRELPPGEIRGLHIWEEARQGMTRSTRPGYVTSYWAVRFKNETPKEIGSITLQAIGFQGGRPSFRSQQGTVRTFVNAGVAHRGSLLPGEKTEFDRFGIVRLDFPEEKLGQMGDGMRLELISATGFRRGELHDPGHLYSYFHNMRGPQIIAQLKRAPSLIRVRNVQGTTATLMAFESCDPDVIRYILSHGGSANDRTERGSTIMHMAAMNGYQGVMDLAYKLGGNPNAKTASGRTPLMKAISRGQRLGWQWLLTHRADMRAMSQTGETAASVAIIEGQVGALEDLVKAGLSPKSRDVKGMGWLDYSTRNIAILDRMIRYKLPIDGRNPLTGATPLMLASRQGVPGVVIWFLMHGANPNLKDRKGRSAYEYAKEGGVNLVGLVRRFGMPNKS